MRKLAMLGAAVLVIAAASSAQAGMGASLLYNGSFEPAIGINFQPSGWTVDVLASFASVQDSYTRFGGIVVLDKMMNPDGTTGLWGLCAGVDIWSPEVGDSYNDIFFGGQLGGSAPIVDNFTITGHMGVKVFINGARSDLDDSSTNFGTFANIMFRWMGLWGQ